MAGTPEDTPFLGPVRGCGNSGERRSGEAEIGQGHGQAKMGFTPRYSVRAAGFGPCPCPCPIDFPPLHVLVPAVSPAHWVGYSPVRRIASETPAGRGRKF